MSHQSSRRDFLYRDPGGFKSSPGLTGQTLGPSLFRRSRARPDRPFDAPARRWKLRSRSLIAFLPRTACSSSGATSGPPALGLSPWTSGGRGVGRKAADSLSIDDLKGLEPVTLPAVLQCSGNGRGFFSPTIPGVGWEKGAVGNAEWSGVQTARPVLEPGRVSKPMRPTSNLMGIGYAPPNPKTPAFFRSIPLARGISIPPRSWPCSMNGEPLPLLHGGPIRLVVPGWAGNHWIKWLRKVIDQPGTRPQASTCRAATRSPRFPPRRESTSSPIDLQVGDNP